MVPACKNAVYESELVQSVGCAIIELGLYDGCRTKLMKLYDDFDSQKLRLNQEAFEDALQDWPPSKLGELKVLIRQRFGDENFTTSSIYYALDDLRDWPLDRPTQEVLIRLGNTNLTSPDLVEVLNSLRTFYWFFMAGFPDRRFPCLDALSPNEGAALIRGLAIAEEHGYTKYGGSSVSLVSNAFYHFEKFGSRAWAPLADWLIVHTTNPCIPFNFRRTRHQWEKCRDICEQPEETWKCVCATECRRLEEKAVRQLAAQQRESTDQEAKRLRKIRIAERRLRQHEVRAAVIAKLQGLSPIERLEYIVSDTEHPVKYFPADYAILDPSICEAMSPSLRRDLIDRLSDRNEGVWFELRQQLKDTTK